MKGIARAIRVPARLRLAPRAMLRFCLAALAMLLPLSGLAQPPPGPAPAQDPQAAAPQAAAEVIDLSFQSIPVRSALQILADAQGFNLVAGGAVSGEITLQLDSVGWEQALELVLRAGNLAHRMEGNVMYVTTAEEMALQRERELEASRQALELAPLGTELLPVNYADASAILDLVRGADSGPAAAEGSRGLLSSRGSAAVDVRTNTIIARDLEPNLAAVRALLESLDVAVGQVLIEARIVNVSTDYSRDFGARWAAAGTASGNGKIRYGLARGMTPGATPEAPGDALALDLGFALRSTLGIGYTGNSELIELELAALESSGHGEIIARPRVATQDKVTAEIRSGVRIPYQSQAGGAAGGSVTQFEDAVLLLRVTPRITPNGRINMQLEVRQDSVSPTASGVPAINTNEVVTSALVDDGETIVLGGVFREEATATESRTPVLADIPGLGRLFKRTISDTRRTELLIFITTSIMPDGV